MRRMILWLAVLLCMAAAPLAPTGDFSKGTSTAANGSTARSLAQRASDVVNVMDYGAKCDGVTDDTAAINSATAAVRALSTSIGFNGSNGPYSAIVFPTAAKCLINGAMNFTGLVGFGVSVDGSGSTIYCKNTGGICLDAIGSRWIHFRDLTIVGDTTNVPKVLLAIGRTNTAALNSSDQMQLSNVTLSGSATLASLYNFASETDLFDHVKLFNSSSAAGSYALIEDGYNHFGVTSTFITQNAPADSPQSFDENVFVSLTAGRAGGSGNVMWIGNATKLRFISSYGETNAGVAAVLYTEASGSITMLSMDMHFETTGLTDVFLLSGANATPTIFGLSYYDQQPVISDAVFKLDTGVTSAVLRNVDLKIGSFAGSSTLFNTPANFSMSGDLYTTSIAPVNMPALWQGRLFIGQNQTGAYYGPGAYFALQAPDSTATGGNARGNQSVDLQTNRGNASAVASGNLSAVIGGSGNQSSGTEAITGGAANTASATAAVALGQQIILTANWSAGFGKGCEDHGNTGTLCFGSGFISVQGDSQFQLNTLHQTGTAAMRLTADGATASGLNCVFIPVNTTYGGVHIKFSANDVTTPGNSYSAVTLSGVLGRVSTAASTTWAGELFTLPHQVGADTFTLPTVTADTTNACLNVSWTPPNSDTWHTTAVVQIDSTQ